MAKTDNKARQQRILDAAASLFVRYGYDKTAVSDIAHDAGVSQGTIYLHFESKDALFEGLFIREMQRFAEAWLERIEADPNGGTIGGMYKNMLYAMSGNAFMSAMFRRDRRVLGNYLRKPSNFLEQFQAGQSQSPRYEFVRMMQDAGAMRADLDPGIVSHIMNMLAYGLVGMDEIMPAEAIPPIDDLIEGIAQIMDRALTPEGENHSAVGKAIVREIFEASRQKYEQMENPNEEQQEKL